MQQLRSWLDRVFTPRMVLVIGWCWFLLYAYPGFMTAEGVEQLYQARGMRPVTDWDPPLLAFIWHFVDNVVAGPFGMLVLASVPFLAGCYFILVRVMSRRAAALTAVGLLVFPSNIVVLAVVWKHALLAGFLVSGIAGLLARELRWRIAGCAFVFLATAMRYNAAAATLPLVLLLWDRDIARAWYKRYAIALGVWIGLTAAAFGANAAVTSQGTQPLDVGNASNDIAGILHLSPDLDVDQLIRETPEVPWRPGVDVREAVTHFRPGTPYHHVYAATWAIFERPEFGTQADALGDLRRRLIREHPGTFVRHRFAVWRARLDSRVSVFHSFNIESAESDTHHRGSSSSTQRTWVRANQWILSLKIFRPRMFFMLSIVLLFFARRNRFAVALLLSGIANELALLAVGPAAAYADSHWAVFCTIFATVLLVLERARAARGGDARSAVVV